MNSDTVTVDTATSDAEMADTVTGNTMTTGPAIANSTRRGRTRITSRALTRIVAAVTADTLQVNADHVTVDITDDKGKLSLSVRTPIKIVALSRITHDLSVLTRTGGTVLERATAAQGHIRTRVGDLTGSRISRVFVRLTGVDIQPEKRVE